MVLRYSSVEIVNVFLPCTVSLCLSHSLYNIPLLYLYIYICDITVCLFLTHMYTEILNRGMFSTRIYKQQKKKKIYAHNNIRCVVCFLDGHNPRDLSYPIGHQYQRKTRVERPTSDRYIGIILCFYFFFNAYLHTYRFIFPTCYIRLHEKFE